MGKYLCPLGSAEPAPSLDWQPHRMMRYCWRQNIKAPKSPKSNKRRQNMPDLGFSEGAVLRRGATQRFCSWAALKVFGTSRP